jgi:NAD(P)-dependent dehydrogenase (short-subunit alcohol dehydrogenase family)
MGPIEEQTILITGATSGLGQALAQALARHGATLLLHGRDPKYGLETVRKIKEATGNERIKFCRAVAEVFGSGQSCDLSFFLKFQ